MKFSATAVAVLLSLCLAEGASIQHADAADAVPAAATVADDYGSKNFPLARKFQLRHSNKVGLSAPRPLWERETAPIQKKKQTKSVIRPLWEENAQETLANDPELAVEHKREDVGFLGVLANANRRQRHGGGHDNHRNLQVCDPSYGCDCDAFDEESGTGLFQCVELFEDGSVATSTTAIFDDMNYQIEVVLEDPESGLSYGYEIVTEDGVATSCLGVMNGCECPCTLGLCPLETDVGPVSFACPGIDVMDACVEELDMFAMAANAEVCASESAGTVAPSMDESMGGTMMESLGGTMMST